MLPDPRNFEIVDRASRMGKFELKTLELMIPGLPSEFENYRIIQLTDLHFGFPTTLTHIENALALVAELSPQLLLLTGDYLQLEPLGMHQRLADLFGPGTATWHAYRKKVRHAADKLASLFQQVTVEDGIYGVFGNHDHLEGVRIVERAFKKHVWWLKNHSASVTRASHSLLIGGIDDLNRGAPDLPLSLNGHAGNGYITSAVNGQNGSDAPSSNHVFKILLSHNPDIVLHSDQALLGGVDLILCGHTHGGQVCLPGARPIVTRTKQLRYVRGLNWHNNTAVYVSKGLGYGNIPFRLFCPPEITLFVLRRRSPLAPHQN